MRFFLLAILVGLIGTVIANVPVRNRRGLPGVDLKGSSFPSINGFKNQRPYRPSYGGYYVGNYSPAYYAASSYGAGTYGGGNHKGSYGGGSYGTGNYGGGSFGTGNYGGGSYAGGSYGK